MNEAWSRCIDDYVPITSTDELASYVGESILSSHLPFDADCAPFIHELMVKISTDANSFFPKTSQDWGGEYTGTPQLRLFFRMCLGFVSQNNYPDGSLNGCIRDFACYLVKELEVDYNLEDAGIVAILLRKIQGGIEPDEYQIKQEAFLEKLADAIDPHNKRRGRRLEDGETMEEISNSNE